MAESNKSGIKFLGVKAVALPVVDEARAERFYGETLGLPVAYENGEACGYLFGETILLLKPDWYAPPSAEPSPRITLQVEDAPAAERLFKELGVVIADVPESDGHGCVGSFLDSEGNKLWFCSYV
jgi:catechol 2,3-dioxygenase-like lactoylglutathione lyase family enzyme